MSPEYSKRGREQLAKRLQGKITRPPGGQGRISKGLGADDPRHRRNDQQAQATDQRYGPEFRTDRQGRIRPRS